MKKLIIYFSIILLIFGCSHNSQISYDDFTKLEEAIIKEYYKADIKGAIEKLHELIKLYKTGKESNIIHVKWDMALALSKARLADIYKSSGSLILHELYLNEAVNHYNISVQKDPYIKAEDKYKITKEELMEMIQKLDNKNKPNWKK